MVVIWGLVLIFIKLFMLFSISIKMDYYYLYLEVNECAAAPCQNGGHCVVTWWTPTPAFCTTGFEGTNCETGNCSTFLFLLPLSCPPSVWVICVSMFAAMTSCITVFYLYHHRSNFLGLFVYFKIFTFFLPYSILTSSLAFSLSCLEYVYGN